MLSKAGGSESALFTHNPFVKTSYHDSVLRIVGYIKNLFALKIKSWHGGPNNMDLVTPIIALFHD